MFWTLLGCTVTKSWASPRNSTWFTRPFLLVRGAGSRSKTTKWCSGNWVFREEWKTYCIWCLYLYAMCGLMTLSHSPATSDWQLDERLGASLVDCWLMFLISAADLHNGWAFQEGFQRSLFLIGHQGTYVPRSAVELTKLTCCTWHAWPSIWRVISVCDALGLDHAPLD